MARADGTYASELGRISRFDVLVLDDFLIAPMKDTERRDLLEVLEDRYDHSSTVITSQVPTKTWHEMLSVPTIADAICDRLVHNAHILLATSPTQLADIYRARQQFNEAGVADAAQLVERRSMTHELRLGVPHISIRSA